jgi:hypothetical protein
MRLSLAAAAALLAVAAPCSVDAQPADGPELALRLGVAPALGSIAADVPVEDGVNFQLPVQVDVLWRFGKLAAGLYGSGAWARVGDCAGAGAAAGGRSCSASVWRLGVQATRSFDPHLHGAEPWLGLATGYEWARERRATGGTAVETTWRGFELIAVQGGLDWRVAPWAAVGPFLLVGGGRYSGIEMDTGLEAASAEIADKAVHVWIHVGVRGRFILGVTR